MIKKINASKKFNTGAIIVTPRTQLLTYRSLRSVHLLFVQLTLLSNPQNRMLYNAFQSARQLKSAPCYGGICTRCVQIPWTRLTQPPNYIWICSAVFAQLSAESPCTLQCALKRD